MSVGLLKVWIPAPPFDHSQSAAGKIEVPIWVSPCRQAVHKALLIMQIH